MKLELYYDNGTKECYDTSNLTASAPIGGGVCMVEMMPRYYEEDAMAPYGENNRIEAGLWVHMYQFDAAKIGEANSASVSLMTRVGIATKEQMEHALLVKLDDENWLVRDSKTNELVNLTHLQAFGNAYVNNWAGAGVYAGIHDVKEALESIGYFDRAIEDKDIADLLHLPESFVADARKACSEPEDDPEIVDPDDLEDYDDGVE